MKFNVPSSFISLPKAIARRDANKMLIDPSSLPSSTQALCTLYRDLRYELVVIVSGGGGCTLEGRASGPETYTRLIKRGGEPLLCSA